MNRSVIRYILGYVLMIEGALLLLPVVVAICYGEKQGIWYFFTACICVLAGFWETRKKPSSVLFYLKEGCVATALSWIIMSIMGALPFWLSREIPSYIDALFETISGFTTTGATILDEVESLSHCTLFWRSFSHWIGGMGVLVFLLMIVPLSGGSNMNLMRAESPGPSVGKLVPRLQSTAQILYVIYLGMTLLEMVLLLLGGMNVFEAVNTAFSTAGTGGFGIKNDSMGSYSPYIQWVVAIFMILFSVNFNAYYLILLGKWKKACSMEEVKYFLFAVGVATVLIFMNILSAIKQPSDALRHAIFQVASIISSTGFATMDYNQWPEMAKIILVTIMFIGACAGSTGGGIKVSRIVILIKTVGKELHSYIHPKSIRKVKFDKKPVEHEVVRATNVYFITFMMLFVASVLVVSFEDKGLVTTFTSVAATINNTGPGLDMVGPMGNFGNFHPISKLVFMFDMLAGRLELFPLLILFHPALWKDMFKNRKDANRS